MSRQEIRSDLSPDPTSHQIQHPGNGGSGAHTKRLWNTSRAADELLMKWTPPPLAAHLHCAEPVGEYVTKSPFLKLAALRPSVGVTVTSPARM